MIDKAESHVFLVLSLDFSRETKLHVVCSTREIAEGYRMGIAKREGRSTRLWIDEVIVDHLLASSMGIFSLPLLGAVQKGERDGD